MKTQEGFPKILRCILFSFLRSVLADLGIRSQLTDRISLCQRGEITGQTCLMEHLLCVAELAVIYYGGKLQGTA